MCIRRRHLLWLFSLLLAGCGGGGGGGGGGNTNAWTMGVFPPATNFDAKCVSPRSGTDPATGRAFPDVPGTAADEKMWLRSWTNDLYLWYSEVPDLDPASYTTPQYFDVLMTPAVTPSGNPKDKFHFTLSSAEWFALSQSGASAGYGAQWVLLSTMPPRRAVVAYTDPNSPAAPQGQAPKLLRGTEILTVDGVDLVNANDQASIDTLNAGLFPTAAGQTHNFTVQDVGSQTTRMITMTSAIVISAPVQNAHVITTASGPVGYMLVQRPHRDRGGPADRCDRNAAGWVSHRPRARHSLQRRRIPGSGERTRVHDRRPRTNDRNDLRAAAVQRQASDN